MVCPLEIIIIIILLGGSLFVLKSSFNSLVMREVKKEQEFNWEGRSKGHSFRETGNEEKLQEGLFTI